MKSAVTIAIASEIKQGPWVFWNLEEGMEKAARLGFDAVELFLSAPDAVSLKQLQQLCRQFNIHVCAVGTGAGKVLKGLSLTDPDAGIRQKAVQYIGEMMDFGAEINAKTIIGSMQGLANINNRQQSLNWLTEGLTLLNEKAEKLSISLIYEPLNRYETNLFNTLETATEFLMGQQLTHTKMLADLFHMNMEEVNIARSLEKFSAYIGHIHLADSNRRAAGAGHTNWLEIGDVLKKISYNEYLSAEILPLPDSDAAAQQTIETFRKYFSVQ